MTTTDNLPISTELVDRWISINEKLPENFTKVSSGSG